MSEPLLSTPLDDLTVDALPSTRSPQEEAPIDPSPILSMRDFERALDDFDNASFGCGEWTNDDDVSYEETSQEHSRSRAIVRDAYAELLESYEDLAERSAEQAHRAQVLVLRKDAELAAHDDLHRAAAHRIEQLVRDLAIQQEAIGGRARDHPPRPHPDARAD
jgi:hypothetical protein